MTAQTAVEAPTLTFTEEMKGHIDCSVRDFHAGDIAGQLADCFLLMHLTIEIDDVDKFIARSEHEARVTGYVECVKLWGRITVESGSFNLFTDGPRPRQKRMAYRVCFTTPEGPLTLVGFKQVRDDPGFDAWSDTSTLFTRIIRGHGEPQDDRTAETYAVGIVRIHIGDFARQLASFESSSAGALAQFMEFFLGSLWSVYGPWVTRTPPPTARLGRTIPLFTLDGVKDASASIHPFTTDDGLGLSMVRFRRAPCRDVVVIVHGLTTSTDMFIMPEHYNLVSFLLNRGYTDVWCLDYRMSNRFPYNMTRHRFTMDDIALYDYPAALRTLRATVGPCRIHVISHCLGAVSFTMSLFGKAVDDIASVVANSAALTPRVPSWSNVKLRFTPFLVEYLLGLPYLNPNWSQEPGLTFSKLLVKWLTLVHPECRVSACHMLSLMWGSGRPALYSHENLDEITHVRGGDLYGPTSMHYYRHVRKMVGAGRAVKFAPGDARYASLPDDYLQYASTVETPTLFMTGDRNHVFTDSNIVCFKKLREIAPGNPHELLVIPDYGHQDVFMGKDCHEHVFPRILEFIDRHR